MAAYDEWDTWDGRLPTDISLDDLPDDARALVADAVLSDAIDLLRAPRTPLQLARDLAIDGGSAIALLRSLAAAGLVEELPAGRFGLRSSLIAVHSREHESCDQALANAAAWLSTVHSGRGRDRNREVCVERLVRPVHRAVDLDVLVAELRAVIATATSTGSAVDLAGTPDAELEVQIVLVRRDLDRHDRPPIASA